MGGASAVGVLDTWRTLSIETTTTKKDRMARKRTQPKAEQAQKVGPATQKVLDRIRELYEDEGLGFPSIAKTLDAEKVKTFRGGDKWHAPVVRGIVLRNGWTKGEKKQASAD
jgi:hypothetical protein